MTASWGLGKRRTAVGLVAGVANVSLVVLAIPGCATLGGCRGVNMAGRLRAAAAAAAAAATW